MAMLSALCCLSCLYCVGVDATEATSICFPCYGYRIIVLFGHPANHSELQYWSDPSLHMSRADRTEENNKSQGRGRKKSTCTQDIWRPFNEFPAHSGIASHTALTQSLSPASSGPTASVRYSVCRLRQRLRQTETGAPNEVWLVLTVESQT